MRSSSNPRWVFLLILFLFSFVGVERKEGEGTQTSYSHVPKPSNSFQDKRSCSLSSPIQKNLPLVCTLRLAHVKKQFLSLKYKKAFVLVMENFPIKKPLSFSFSFDFSEPEYSYQFSRLNVLSSQAHPPTSL